jgi:hypothetical protein
MLAAPNHGGPIVNQFSDYNLVSKSILTKNSIVLTKKSSTIHNKLQFYKHMQLSIVLTKNCSIVLIKNSSTIP